MKPVYFSIVFILFLGSLSGCRKDFNPNTEENKLVGVYEGEFRTVSYGPFDPEPSITVNDSFIREVTFKYPYLYLLGDSIDIGDPSFKLGEDYYLSPSPFSTSSGYAYLRFSENGDTLYHYSFQSFGPSGASRSGSYKGIKE